MVTKGTRKTTTKTPIGTAKTTATTGETATVTTPTRAPRGQATKLFAFYEDPSTGDRGLTSFDTKVDLDTWMAQKNCTLITLLRGRERAFKTKVILA